MAACPLDTSRIAFGVGDAMLRVWNLSEPHETSFDVSTLWQKIMGKVRSVWRLQKNLFIFIFDHSSNNIWIFMFVIKNRCRLLGIRRRRICWRLVQPKAVSAFGTQTQWRNRRFYFAIITDTPSILSDGDQIRSTKISLSTLAATANSFITYPRKLPKVSSRHISSMIKAYTGTVLRVLLIFLETKPVIKKDCTEFAWKPDHSCVAVGFEDG